jgi:acetylornithine deacetylase
VLLPQAVNPVELGMVALQEILRRFYADFPAHPDEATYNYLACSSMKPTQVNI